MSLRRPWLVVLLTVIACNRAAPSSHREAMQPGASRVPLQCGVVVTGKQFTVIGDRISATGCWVAQPAPAEPGTPLLNSVNIECERLMCTEIVATLVSEADAMDQAYCGKLSVGRRDYDVREKTPKKLVAEASDGTATLVIEPGRKSVERWQRYPGSDRPIHWRLQ